MNATIESVTPTRTMLYVLVTVHITRDYCAVLGGAHITRDSSFLKLEVSRKNRGFCFYTEDIVKKGA